MISKKILKTVTQMCLLCFISLTAHASVALRVACSGNDQGAVIYVNNTKKGVCPNDIFVEGGDIQFRAVKVVDEDHERIYEENFFIVDGDVKKIKVSLSKPQLSAAAIKRIRIAKLKQEKQLAEETLEQARNGDVNAMNSLVVLYEQGKGLTQSAEKSDYWRAKAKSVQLYNHAMYVLAQAEQGKLNAMDEIIDIYAAGKGVAVDADKAQFWRDKRDAIRKAKYERVAQELLKKAQAGDMDAMQSVSAAYRAGDGLEHSVAKAEEWEKKYSLALEEYRLSLLKESELTQKEEDLANIEFDTTINWINSQYSETQKQSWLMFMTALPSFVTGSIIDGILSPYKTTKQTMLENEIEAHAAQWGAPDSMLANARQ